MQNRALAAISLMPQDDFRESVEVLLRDGVIEAVEWSFDMGWGLDLPDWVEAILKDYERKNKLFGHGVNCSPCSMQSNDAWLQRLKLECAERQFGLISEHYGFMHTREQKEGAPFPVPYAPPFVSATQQCLRTMIEISGCPVGLENLAFSFSRVDALSQGAILEAIVSPINGFLLLDVHNFYCQLHNFKLEPQELLDTIPLNRVRAIHISGGSWTDLGNVRIRRDTHDSPVPLEVFELLPIILKQCPNVQYVVLERLGNTLPERNDRIQLVNDFHRMREITAGTEVGASTSRTVRHREPEIYDLCIDGASYYQDRLLELLNYCETPSQVIASLLSDNRLTALTSYFESFDPHMVAIAQELVRRWSMSAT
jgi:uncharacterized protein (UPF0276 family)